MAKLVIMESPAKAKTVKKISTTRVMKSRRFRRSGSPRITISAERNLLLSAVPIREIS